MSEINWTGTWHGVIKTYPNGQLGDGWNVTFVLGLYPLTDQTCTIWNKTFYENQTIKLIKDYRLCRGINATDLYIDEGNGVTLSVQWINHVLVSPFKYKGLFSISSMQIRNDILEEQIIITEDLSADKHLVVSQRAISIHLTQMKKSQE